MIRIKIINDDGKINITNEDLDANSFSLLESICSETWLKFGCCESSILKFTTVNRFIGLQGQWLNVSIEEDGNSVNVGRYKVRKDTPTANKEFRDITAYDIMYDILQSDISNWYNNLLPDSSTTVTLKEFRDSFCEHLGVVQVGTELINDSMIVERTVNPSDLSGKDIITSICELNGVFGHINSDGKLEYISLDASIHGLYPRNDLYPANDLYPSSSGGEKILKSTYISCEYEDFVTKYIGKLVIRQEEEDAGITIGYGINTYKVEGNFLVYGKSSEELLEIGTNLFNKIKDVVYRPAKVECIGDISRRIGSAIKLITKYDIVETFILQREYTGIQSPHDNYIADGNEYCPSNINEQSVAIMQLKSKTNVLTRDVDQTKSQITSINEDLEEQQTQITQNSKEINLKVSKGDVSSEISQEAGDITIKANRVSIESDKFKLNKNGAVEASDMKITGGSIKLTALEQSNQIVINREEGSGTIGIAFPVCNFIGRNGAKIAFSLDQGTVYCEGSGGERLAVVGVINVFENGATFNGTVYTPDGTVSKSDFHIKKDFERLNEEESSDFICSLIPYKYRLKNGTSNRYHHGFIAQQVKKAMGDNDWGVYVEDEQGIKGLRYEELIADLIATVKFQDKRISELERRFFNE